MVACFKNRLYIYIYFWFSSWWMFWLQNFFVHYIIAWQSTHRPISVSQKKKSTIWLICYFFFFFISYLPNGVNSKVHYCLAKPCYHNLHKCFWCRNAQRVVCKKKKKERKIKKKIIDQKKKKKPKKEKIYVIFAWEDNSPTDWKSTGRLNKEETLRRCVQRWKVIRTWWRERWRACRTDWARSRCARCRSLAVLAGISVGCTGIPTVGKTL